MKTQKLKILFIQPPHYFEGGSSPPSNFPLGICYIASLTKQMGHEVDILDLWIEDKSKEEVIKLIKKLSIYNAIGISALSTQYKYIKFLANELKKYFPNIPLVLGNALATHSSHVVLKNTSIDICVRGEGEETFKKLLEKKFNDLDTIEGISFKKDNQIIDNRDRIPIGDLDSIPYPDYNIFDIERYLKNMYIFSDKRFHAMNIITGRGCPYKCNFCSRNYHNYRFRSVENVIKEIELFKQKYKIKGVFFLDELVVFNEKRTRHFCKELKRLKLVWNCQARVNHVNPKLLKIMRNSGCAALGLGIESGSQVILDKMNKKLKKEDSIKAIKMLVNSGMYPILQLMYGYPGETDETLNETIQFFKDSNYYAKNFSITTPLPGSNLYDDCVKNKLILNEDKYLFELDQGYNYRTSPIINLTEFSDDEFMQKNYNLEKTIWENYQAYLKNHKLNKINLDIKKKYYRELNYYKVFGFWKLLIRIIKSLNKYMKKKLRNYLSNINK